MLAQSHPVDTNPPQTDPVQLVDLALSGEYPGLLVMLISPGLAESIYKDIEHSSKDPGRYN